MGATIYLTPNPAGMVLRRSGGAVHTNDAAIPLMVRAIEFTIVVRPRSGFDKRPAVVFRVLNRVTNVFVRMFRHIFYRKGPQAENREVVSYASISSLRQKLLQHSRRFDTA
jgi:hypothetical protein